MYLNTSIYTTLQYSEYILKLFIDNNFTTNFKLSKFNFNSIFKCSDSFSIIPTQSECTLVIKYSFCY